VTVSHDIVGERFERWARHYDESPLRPAFEAAHRAVLVAVARLGADPGRVLDIGCGTGLLLRRAALVFPRAAMVGVDASGQMLAVARAAAPATGAPRFARARAERLPFPDRAFDLVLATMSARHWADRAAGLREVGRVLRPGGLFALADVASGGPSRRPIQRLRLRRAAPSVELRLAGFAPADVTTSHGYGPIGTVSVVVARPAG